MYCSSCGVSVAHGLSYCNHCGAKLLRQQDENPTQSPGPKPEALVWGMVAVFVFGLIALVFLIMAMKMVGLNVGQILACIVMSFAMMLLVESVFILQLWRRTRVDEKVDRPARSNELAGEVPRRLREPMPSVTEHTTRAFEPAYKPKS